MKEFTDLLDKYFLVFYTENDILDDCCFRTKIKYDLIFVSFDSALKYVKEANKNHYNRIYRIVSVPVIK